MAAFPPTDRRCGSVVWLRGKAGRLASRPSRCSDNVGRVADVQAADFRGAGKLDLIVAVFGWHDTGEILYLENQTTDWDQAEIRAARARQSARHHPRPGRRPQRRRQARFRRPHRQEHETVVAFLNEGGGQFRKKTLYTAPHPGYGTSGIQLVDLNGDGKLDVLYTNGDILDEPYLFKPYHGVQWLENQRRIEIRPPPDCGRCTAFINAVAVPVAGKKIPDVLAVSFLPANKFPDRGRKADAVVYFEQVSPGKFDRHTLASDRATQSSVRPPISTAPADTI